MQSSSSSPSMRRSSSRLMSTTGTGTSYQQAAEAFRRFDKNNNNRIDMSEFYEMLQAMSNGTADEREAVRLFNLIDRDSSGDVDFEEYLGWVFTASGREASKESNPDAFETGLDLASKASLGIANRRKSEGLALSKALLQRRATTVAGNYVLAQSPVGQDASSSPLVRRSRRAQTISPLEDADSSPLVRRNRRSQTIAPLQESPSQKMPPLRLGTLSEQSLQRLNEDKPTFTSGAAGPSRPEAKNKRLMRRTGSSAMLSQTGSIVMVPEGRRSSQSQLTGGTQLARPNQVPEGRRSSQSQLTGGTQLARPNQAIHEQLAEGIELHFTHGPDFKWMMESITKALQNSCTIRVSIDNRFSGCGRVVANIGEGVLLWDKASMMAYHDYPFETLESTRVWLKELKKVRLPQLMRVHN